MVERPFLYPVEAAAHQQKFLAVTELELHFYLVERYAGEIQNRIFRDVRWATREEMPGYDFLEADVAFIKELAEGKISFNLQRLKPKKLTN